MAQMRYPRSNLQAYPRIRVPEFLVQFLRQIHVIRAICRHPEIDRDDLYGEALAGLRDGDNAKAFSAVNEFVHEFVQKVTPGALLDGKDEEPKRGWIDIVLCEVDEQTASRICDFNHKFLNDKGDSALITLLTFDAGHLDPAAIDIFRGGDALRAAYGSRRTRRDKRLGKEIQSQIKRFSSVDDPATMEAADRYAEYHYLCNGSLSTYKMRKELEGDTHDDRYYGDWFPKFDRAFGFPRTGPGRPSSKTDHR